MSCKHTEGDLPDGRRVAGHDCDYVDRRVALIPRAEEVADRAAGPEPVDSKADPKAHPRWCAAWNLAFHAEMDRLSAEAEAKHGQMGKQAQTEVLGTMRRWRRKGLTLQQAGDLLRSVREAI